MPNRDYAIRSKKAGRGVNKLFILIIVAFLLAISGLALWMLQEKSMSLQPVPKNSASQAKNTLPSPPQEIYSYIRDLENREVPIDKNSKLARLTKEQEQLLQQQKEEEKRKQEQVSESATTLVAEPEKKNDAKAETADEVAKKAAEEKRKAELKKQQETAKKESDLKAAEQKAKAEVEKKVEQVKAKPVEAKSTEPKTAETAKTIGKFGLQCGAFKNKAQAENMQARLAMAGYNARINSSGEWNRVVVGPLGDRTAASQAQANARSVAECLIVGM